MDSVQQAMFSIVLSGKEVPDYLTFLSAAFVAPSIFSLRILFFGNEGSVIPNGCTRNMFKYECDEMSWEDSCLNSQLLCV